MKLNDLIKNTNCTLVTGDPDTEITDITLNSREVTPGSLFIAIRGAVSDGHNYIDDAISRGTSAILVEDIPEKKYENLAIVQVPNTEESLGHVAANFFGHPSDELTVIGVTGTKGKTTVANMVRCVLEEMGIPCGIMGTLGVHYADVDLHPHNTTPDSIVIQRALRGMADNDYKYVVMEASSQGFKRNRTKGLEFDVGVFLNIDQDHIGKGEHDSFEEYLNCKRQIFDQSKIKLINREPKYYDYLTDEDTRDALTFSVSEPADYRAENISPVRNKHHLGMHFDLTGKANAQVDLNVPGIFSIENALAVIGIIDQLGLDLKKAIKSIENFQPDGRAEVLDSAGKYGRTVLVDFAHNRLSIESVLKAMRIYNPKRLISMFGLHWDETEMRRFDQGYAAGKNSDYTILTSDHVGPISFEEINVDTIKGLEESQGEYSVIEDRKEAIEHAIEVSDEDDIVVLFGMGNERSQKILDKEVYFSEEEIVEDYLKEHVKN